MQKRIRLLRMVALVLLGAYAQMAIFPVWSAAQTPDCGYDSKAPTLEHARRNFKALNYKCAEMELTDLLKVSELSLEDKSNAHILLAAVYYAMLKDDSEKRSMVMQQFKAAFKAYREWKGELDIKSPEFMEMMKEAQLQVDTEGLKEEPKPVVAQKPAEDTARKITAPPPVTVTPAKKDKEGKAWYKQWWAIGLGVGLVAGAVVMMGGGDDAAPPPLDTLPSFPDPPTKR